jgi:hypothetical protein
MTRRGHADDHGGVDGDRYRRSDGHRNACADHRGGGDQHGSPGDRHDHGDAGRYRHADADSGAAGHPHLRRGARR